MRDLKKGSVTERKYKEAVEEIQNCERKMKEATEKMVELASKFNPRRSLGFQGEMCKLMDVFSMWSNRKYAASSVQDTLWRMEMAGELQLEPEVTVNV